jgi:hypothetical protein
MSSNNNRTTESSNQRVFARMNGKYSSVKKPILTRENLLAHNRSIARNEHGYILMETREGTIEKRYIFPTLIRYMDGSTFTRMMYDDDDNEAWTVSSSQQDFCVYHDDDTEIG